MTFKVDIVFSEQCNFQLRIVSKCAHSKNEDFLALYNQVRFCLKAINELNSVHEVPLGIRNHKGNEISGVLTGKLEGCESRDLDNQHRIVYFPINDNSIVISSLGHYDNFLNSQGNLFENLSEQYKTIKNFDENEIQILKCKSVGTIASLSFDGLPNLKKEIIDIYNGLSSRELCPIGMNSVTSSLLKTFKSDTVLSPDVKEKKVFDFLKNEEHLISRTWKNTELFKKNAAIVLGDGNLVKTVEKMLQINKASLDEFSRFIYCCIANVPNHKTIEVTEKCCQLFLKSLQQQNQNIASKKENIKPISSHNLISQVDSVFKKFDELFKNKVFDIFLGNHANKIDFSKDVKLSEKFVSQIKEDKLKADKLHQIMFLDINSSMSKLFEDLKLNVSSIEQYEKQSLKGLREELKLESLKVFSNDLLKSTDDLRVDLKTKIEIQKKEVQNRLKQKFDNHFKENNVKRHFKR